MNPDFVRRTARVLTANGLSLAEYQVMCSAGYRVTLPPLEFVEHAFQACEGDSRGQPSRTELLAAFEHLQACGFMVCLTEADLREEAERRAISTIPEVFDRGYDVGHVDFTHRGYALYRQAIQDIHGDDFLLSTDAGFNLDTDAGRFDVYAVNAENCRRLLDEIQADGDSYTGVEATFFVGRDGPNEIGEWRPNRFLLRAAGYHGVLHYISSAAKSATVGQESPSRG